MSRDQFGEQEEKSEILPPSCFRSWSNCTFCCLEAAFRIPLEPLFKGRWFLVKGSKLFPQLDQAVRLSVWQGICLIPRGDQAVGQSLHFGKALDTGPRHSCKWPTVVLSVTFTNSCFTSHIQEQLFHQSHSGTVVSPVSFMNSCFTSHIHEQLFHQSH